MKCAIVILSLIQLSLTMLANDESEPQVYQQQEEQSDTFSQSADESNFSTSDFNNHRSESDTEKSGYVSHMPNYVDQSQFNPGTSSNNGVATSDHAQQASSNVPIVSGQGHVHIGSAQQVMQNQVPGSNTFTGHGPQSSSFGYGGSGIGQVGYGGSNYVQGGNIVSGVSHVSLGGGYGVPNNVHVPQIVSGFGPVSTGNAYIGSNQGPQIVSGLGPIVTGQGIPGHNYGTGIVSGQPQVAQNSVAKPGQGSIAAHTPLTEVIHQEHHIVYEVPKPSSTIAVKPVEVTVASNVSENDKPSVFGAIKPFFTMFTLIKIAMKIALIAFIFFMSKSLIATLPVMLVGALAVISLCTFTPLCHMKITGYGNTHHLRSFATPERLYAASKLLKSAIEKYEDMKSIAENEVKKRR